MQSTPENTEPVEVPSVEATPPLEPTPEPVPEPTSEPVPEPEQPAQPKVDWKDRRIAQLTAQLHAARAAQSEPTTTSAPPSQDDIDRLANERAQIIAAANVFTQRLNEVEAAGKAAYPDFAERVQSVLKLVDGSDPTSKANYNSFLSAALETGEAARLIHQLGGDLNEASRIMSLPPMKMAVELTKMAARPPTEVSTAPRPITPVGSVQANRSPISPDDADRADRLSVEEWMTRRNAQVAERSARRR